jgi:hypothetical protein
MTDLPKRGRGRPRLDPNGGPSAVVALTVTAADYDKAYALARQRRESLQDLIRRGLRNEIRRALAPPPR